ncbi:MAG: AAA family ATPase, partial [Vicinamibacteria bacterium]
MTERLKRLTMRSFRGVPGEMEVDFGNGQSIAVYGDNGTGKSTIADALEWFFTGGIELLSHEGRQHAVRNLGGAGTGDTSVEIVTSGALGGKAVFPDERAPESFGIGRETFLLRGRTLADFINKTKTEKWKALAELLGLDAIELLRQDLQRARTDIKKQVKAAEEKIGASKAAIAGTDAAVTEEGVLETLQQFCRVLGVEVPDSLASASDPGWIAALAGESGEGRGSRLEAVASMVSSFRAPALDSDALRAWNGAVASNEGAALSRLTFFRDADALLSSSPRQETCPLCGRPVQGEELASRVRGVLTGLLDSAREMERIGEKVQECRDGFTGALEARRAFLAQAKSLRIDVPEPPSIPSQLPAGIERREAIDLTPLEGFHRDLAAWDEAARAAVQKSSPASAGTRSSQLAQLGILCDHIRAWRLGERDLARAKKALDLAERVYDAYQD